MVWFGGLLSGVVCLVAFLLTDFPPLSPPPSSSFAIDSDITTSVSWTPDNQLVSCSDDKTMAKWNSDGDSSGKLGTLSSVYSTSISWFPATGKQAPDIFALSCTDGSFKFMSKSGREEKVSLSCYRDGLLFYTVVVLFHVEWCIRQL